MARRTEGPDGGRGGEGGERPAIFISVVPSLEVPTALLIGTFDEQGQFRSTFRTFHKPLFPKREAREKVLLEREDDLIAALRLIHRALERIRRREGKGRGSLPFLEAAQVFDPGTPTVEARILCWHKEVPDSEDVDGVVGHEGEGKTILKGWTWQGDEPPREWEAPGRKMARVEFDDQGVHVCFSPVFDDGDQRYYCLFQTTCEKERGLDIAAAVQLADQPLRTCLPAVRVLLDQPTRIDRQAGLIRRALSHLPFRQRVIPSLRSLKEAEVERILEEHGERQACKKGLLEHWWEDEGQRFGLSKKAETELRNRMGPHGYREPRRDQDGQEREYWVKRFKQGRQALEVRLTWYGSTAPFTDEAIEKLEEAAEQEERPRHLDYRTFARALRDANTVMRFIWDRFSSDRRNPVRIPAWEFRLLLECENDPNGFRRVEGALQALGYLEFRIKRAGSWTAGRLIGTLEYQGKGPGSHKDGDFLIQIEPLALGCLRLFEIDPEKLRSPKGLLAAYDWNKPLTRNERKELTGSDGYRKGASTLREFFDRAKGFSDTQKNLRTFIEHNITARKNRASQVLWGKAYQTIQAKSRDPEAEEPRLYDRNICPLLPEGRRFQGVLGHFSRNPERGWTLEGTGQSEGLLGAMGHRLPEHHHARAKVLRFALEDMSAVVVEALRGVVVAVHEAEWISIEEASTLPREDVISNVRWYFFLPEDWVEHQARYVETYHAERYRRGETPYRIRTTRSREEYEMSREAGFSPTPAEEPPKADETTGEAASPDGEAVNPPSNEAGPLRIRLKDARELAGKLQGEIAEVLGVSQMTVSRWERGQKPIPDKRLPAIEELIVQLRESAQDRPEIMGE